MGRYIITRILQGVITLWLISVAVFFILRLGGGNPIDYMLPEDATPEDHQLMTESYGFDKPIIEQYWIYILCRVTWAMPWLLTGGPPWK